MAQETITRLIDDLDGSDADETLQFSIGSRSYSIDLNKANADELRVTLAPFVEVATPVSNGMRSTPAPSRGRSRVTRVESDANAVRAWATANGKQVSNRGRISRELRAEYDAAMAS